MERETVLKSTQLNFPGEKGPGSRVFRALRFLVVGAAVYFVGQTLLTNLSAFRDYDFRIDWRKAVFAVFWITAYLALQATLWRRILFWCGITARRTQVLWGFFVSLLGKYIPGKVWVAAFRVLSLENHRSRARILSSILIEHFYLLLSGFLYFAVVWGPRFVTGTSGRVGLFALLSLAVAIAVVLPEPLIRLGLKFSKRYREVSLDPVLGPGRAALLLAAYFAMWNFLSLGIWAMASALTPTPFPAVPVIGSAFALSFMAGFLVLLAPGGLGVRESAFILLASSLMPDYVAGIIAVALRLAFTAAELSGILLLAVVRKYSDDTFEKATS